jgi:serine/threonine-protein phosphatase CPPED1
MESSMKRLLTGAAVMLLVVAAVAVSRSANTKDTTTSGALQVKQEERNPWSHLKLNNDPTTFRFAIASDRTGGPRDGVFERAVDQLNLLQPEFVVCVGDLIQGNTEDLAKLNKEWKQFNGWIDKLEMPFFYTVGNHDIANAVMDQKWRDQFGRRYYHFVYKNVLFLMLNTEDPPMAKSAGKFSKEQLAYVRQVLQENRNVRWTLIFLHKPVWTYADFSRSGWLEIEQGLTGRRYSVFAGHKHSYERFLRNGQKYYMLATTGGDSKLRGAPLGEFDHLVWVTMKRDGPVLANLMMEGIFSEEIPRLRPVEDEDPTAPKKGGEKKTAGSE